MEREIQGKRFRERERERVRVSGVETFARNEREVVVTSMRNSHEIQYACTNAVFCRGARRERRRYEMEKIILRLRLLWLPSDVSCCTYARHDEGNATCLSINAKTASVVSNIIAGPSKINATLGRMRS